ncbi:hypothetical protein [Blastococcus sp. TF02-09]|nr:hypothetical protein [Blastococcus sp. TF02-9]
MAWWAWLLLGWSLLACVLAVVLGRALRTSEDRDRVRRGLPDRRHTRR